MDNKLKGLFLFAGIGACEKAFERLKTKYGFEMENTGFAEIDQFAIKSYCAIHNVSENMNYGDVSKINPNDIADFDFMMWGFPCTDISRAGKQKGFTDENGDYTRSGMYYPALEILKAKKPKFSIIENVKALTDKTFEYELNAILEDLENAGYRNYAKVLNAKDYGIPQNRERIFIVSVREDIKQGVVFPKGFDNGLRLKDLLENDVPESYFLSDDLVEKFIKKTNKTTTNEDKINVIGNINPSGNGMNGEVFGVQGLSPTITTNKGEGIKVLIDTRNEIIEVGKLKDHRHSSTMNSVLNVSGICPAIDTMQDGNREPKIFVTKDNSLIEVGSLKGCGGPYDKLNEQPCRVYHPDGIAPTLHTCGGGNLEPKILQTSKVMCLNSQVDGKQPPQHERIYNDNGVMTAICAEQGGRFNIYESQKDRIRKLTERECWRLFGFADSDIDKVKAIGISKSQMYKQAGNSIVIDVLEHILYELLIVKHPANTLDLVQRQLTLF